MSIALAIEWVEPYKALVMNQFRPAPKPKKHVKSRKNLREIKDYVTKQRDGVCLYGLSTGKACSAGLDPHHIKSVGSGGANTAENLITLCRKHHNEAQENKIRRGQLRKILAQYHKYKYTPEELNE